MEVSINDGRFLVTLARQAIMVWLRENRKLSPPNETPPRLYEKCGVFVTLNRFTPSRDLRGCIGLPYPVKPLVEATIEAAVDAATADPRFPSIPLNELDNQIVIEVSVLTPPEWIEVSDPKDLPKNIKIGKDGLIVEREWTRGLLLPQVAGEWNMNAEEFLTHCCLKAGLPPDCWLVKDTRIQKFQAIIFEEKSPHGPVERKIVSR